LRRPDSEKPGGAGSERGVFETGAGRTWGGIGKEKCVALVSRFHIDVGTAGRKKGETEERWKKGHQKTEEPWLNR